MLEDRMMFCALWDSIWKIILEFRVKSWKMTDTRSLRWQQFVQVSRGSCWPRGNLFWGYHVCVAFQPQDILFLKYSLSEPTGQRAGDHSTSDNAWKFLLSDFRWRWFRNHCRWRQQGHFLKGSLITLQTHLIFIVNACFHKRKQIKQ